MKPKTPLESFTFAFNFNYASQNNNEENISSSSMLHWPPKPYILETPNAEVIMKNN